MRVAVIGLGKLGLPIACAIAEKGIPVVGVDCDQDRLSRIVDGIASTEPMPKVGLTLTTDIEVAIHNTDIAFVIVPTPSRSDRRFDNSLVLAACEGIGRGLKLKVSPYTVVIVSTVMPGSMDTVIRRMLELHSGKTAGVDFDLLYNPQFVALGTVVHDFTTPDLVLIGRVNHSATATLCTFYDKVCKTLPQIAVTSAVNAEVAKLAINCAVSAKITYANQLARVIERIPGADIDVITDIVGTDRRIGKGYLRAGVNYGGPCFPRDVRAMSSLDGSGFFRRLEDSNEEAIGRMYSDVTNAIADRGVLPTTIGILGIPYKVGSDVTEDAVGALLYAALEAAHHTVICDLDTAPQSVVVAAHVVVIALPDDRYRSIPANQFGGKIVIDLWRIRRDLESYPGVDYRALGVGPLVSE